MERSEATGKRQVTGSSVRGQELSRPGGGECFASDFVEALTDEIECATANLKAGLTTYRGADMRWALARALYFRYVNDEMVQREFRTSRLAEGWMSNRFDAALNRAYRPGLHHVIADLTARHSISSQGRCAVAFAVIHPKFVRYVQSIGYGRPSTFFCGTNHLLETELLNAGITVAPSARKPFRRLTDGRQPALHAFALQRELDTHLEFLTSQRPRVVVVIEGNSPFDEVMNQACKLAGVPCVCIQQGWSPIIHSGFRHLSFDRMLVWGDEFGRLLAPFSPDQRFIATGSHVVGPLAEGAPSFHGDAVSFFLQGKAPMIDDTAWHGFLRLVRRVASRLPYTPILVREHPSAPLDEGTRLSLEMPNVRCVNPATLPLYQQMAGSRIGVSLYSTTLLECIAGGVVPVAVNPGIVRSFIPSLAESGAGVEATSFADAEAAIVRLAEDCSFHSSHAANHHALVKRLFNGATRAEAAVAISEELDHAAALSL